MSNVIGGPHFTLHLRPHADNAFDAGAFDGRTFAGRAVAESLLVACHHIQQPHFAPIYFVGERTSIWREGEIPVARSVPEKTSQLATGGRLAQADEGTRRDDEM